MPEPQTADDRTYDRETLKAIMIQAQEAGDLERRDLAVMLLEAEDQWEKQRQRFVLLAEAARNLAALGAAAPADSIWGRLAREVLSLTVEMLGEKQATARMHSMNFEGGVLEMRMPTHWGMRLLTSSLGETLKRGEGEKDHWNNVTLRVTHTDVGPIEVTVQRVSGKTVKQQLEEANAELAKLRAKPSAKPRPRRPPPAVDRSPRIHWRATGGPWEPVLCGAVAKVTLSGPLMVASKPTGVDCKRCLRLLSSKTDGADGVGP
jgi:hypothetical protein